MAQAQPAVNIKSTISGGGLLRTTLPREGVDLGERPDFWKDLQNMQRRFPPRAYSQAGAFYDNGPQLGVAPKSAGSGRVPLFVMPTSIGGGSTFYQPWYPGMPTSPGQSPIAAGYAPEGYGAPKMPENSYFY